MGVIAGVDGYRRGWIAAVERGDGWIEVCAGATLAELIQSEKFNLVVVDIPIGLVSRGARGCDLAARRLLGKPRASSVFPAPSRPMLEAATAGDVNAIWEKACDIRLATEGKRCSRQLAGILPKVAEADSMMTPPRQQRIREGHPEVSFQIMNNGVALRHRKASPAGLDQRLALLRRHFSQVGSLISMHARVGPRVDIVDAFACLWTARRVAAGLEITLPETPEHDDRGLRAEIVA